MIFTNPTRITLIRERNREYKVISSTDMFKHAEIRSNKVLHVPTVTM